MRKKLVSFICAAVMMAAIPMQANAAELTNVNGEFCLFETPLK